MKSMAMVLKNCKACHKVIGFVRSEKGKMIPVDPNLVTAKGTGKETLVMENGFVVVRPAAGVVGWVSHFASCPYANSFRKTEIK